MKIRTLLVDDEKKSLAILENKITRFCPDLVIVGSTQSPKDALTKIEQLKPQLVFLDVEMPVMNGFELLANIKTPDFEVIFATAFNHYAIDAINHCAIGYLTKPINNTMLQHVVENAKKNIDAKSAIQKNRIFIENLSTDISNKKIAIPATDGYDFVSAKEIIRCEGIDGYTKFHLKDRPNLMSSYSIGHFKKILVHIPFFQTHKSHIINAKYVMKYLNEGYIQLIGEHMVPISRARREAFMAFLQQV